MEKMRLTRAPSAFDGFTPALMSTYTASKTLSMWCGTRTTMPVPPEQEALTAVEAQVGSFGRARDQMSGEHGRSLSDLTPLTDRSRRSAAATRSPTRRGMPPPPVWSPADSPVACRSETRMLRAKQAVPPVQEPWHVVQA